MRFLGCFIIALVLAIPLKAQPEPLTGDYVCLYGWRGNYRHYVAREGTVYYGYSTLSNQTENSYLAHKETLLELYAYIDNLELDSLPAQNLDSLINIGEKLDELMVVEIKQNDKTYVLPYFESDASPDKVSLAHIGLWLSAFW